MASLDCCGLSKFISMGMENTAFPFVFVAVLIKTVGKEETHRSYKRDGEVSLASEIQQCTVDASGNNSEKHEKENHRQEEDT